VERRIEKRLACFSRAGGRWLCCLPFSVVLSVGLPLSGLGCFATLRWVSGGRFGFCMPLTFTIIPTLKGGSTESREIPLSGGLYATEVLGRAQVPPEKIFWNSARQADFPGNSAPRGRRNAAELEGRQGLRGFRRASRAWKTTELEGRQEFPARARSLAGLSCPSGVGRRPAATGSRSNGTSRRAASGGSNGPAPDPNPW